MQSKEVYHEQIKRAKLELNKLKRFKQLRSEIILHLYKALIRPLLEYPIIPTFLTPRTTITKIQAVQNHALRLINKDTPPYNVTIEELHSKYDIQPMNIIFYRRAVTIWEKLRTINPEIAQQSEQLIEQPDHLWWPTTAKYIIAGEASTKIHRRPGS